MIILGKYAISLLYKADDLVLRKTFSISGVYTTVIGPKVVLYSSQKL